MIMLRFSADRWSTNRTPSRWSISCCRQAASRPSPSISRFRAGFVEIAHFYAGGPGDVGVLAGEGQAALFPHRQFVAGCDDFRVDQDVVAASFRSASGR